MFPHFPLKKQKALHSLLFIVDKLEKADKHKVFKILYFADQKHLVKYGRPITSDTYMKMQFGPVPSYVKNIVDEEIEHLEEVVAVYNSHYIKNLISADIDFLSESDLQCLQEAIDENKNLDFNTLTNKSHKEAWQNATWQMDYLSIAKEGGADENMLTFIRSNMEDVLISFKLLSISQNRFKKVF